MNLGFPGGSDGKESIYNAGDLGSIPGWGKFPGEAHGNPFQYSCLENPHGQRSLAAYVHKVAKNQTQLKQHMHIYKTDKQIPTAQHREL